MKVERMGYKRARERTIASYKGENQQVLPRAEWKKNQKCKDVSSILQKQSTEELKIVIQMY